MTITLTATDALERIWRFSRKAMWTHSSCESDSSREKTVSTPHDLNSLPKRWTIVSQTKRMSDGAIATAQGIVAYRKHFNSL